MRNSKSNKTDCKKYLLKLLSAMLVVLMMLTLFIACSDKNDDDNNDKHNDKYTSSDNSKTNEELIRECISTFLTAYNNGDIDTVFECLDAKTRNAMESMLKLLGGVAGSYTGFEIDLKDFFSIGVSTVSDDYMLLDIIEVEIQSEDEAIVTTSMTVSGGLDNEKAYFVMVYENNKWCISDITDQKGGDIDENIVSDKNITSIENIDDIEVTFVMNDTLYTGVLNSKGEIFYYIEGDFISWTSVGKGGYVTSWDSDSSGYTSQYYYDIVNENGTIVATSRNGAFDQIVHYGDERILVYKDTSTISKKEHSYGLIDCNTGDWISPLKPCDRYLKSYGESIVYLDDNIYLIFENKVYYIYNSMTGDNIRIWISGGSILHEMIDGKIYGNGEAIIYNNGSDGERLPEYFSLDLNWNVESVEPYYKMNENTVIRKDENEKYYIIENRMTNTSFIYDDFEINQINMIEISGEYVFIKINGADGKLYLNVIDNSRNFLIEPLPIGKANYYSTYERHDDKIIYKNIESDYYCMIDINGNIIIDENKCYEWMHFISNSEFIFARNDEDEEYLLHLNGNPVSIKLKSTNN